MEESCGEVNRLQVPVCDCGTVSTSSGQGDRFNSFREAHESFLCFPFSFFLYAKYEKKTFMQLRQSSHTAVLLMFPDYGEDGQY